MELFLVIGAVFICMIIGAVIDSNNKAESDRAKMEGVLYTQYVGYNTYETASKTKTSTGSAIGRGLVGGALFGPAGAIIGGATAKKKTTSTTQATNDVTFLVFYEDGTTIEDKAIKGSTKYNFYMSKLKRDI